MTLKKGYSENGEMKRCRGPLHPEGVMLPISHFSLIQSGPRKGKHITTCKQCRVIQQGRKPDQRWVPDSQVQPYIEYLVQKLGTQQAVIDRLGKHKSFISRKRENWRYSTFLEIKELVAEVEKTEELKRFKSGGSSAEMVATADIAPKIMQWVENWQAEYPIEEMGRQISDAKFRGDDTAKVWYGAWAWLEEKSEIHRRALYDIAYQKTEYTSLYRADRILTAIGLNHLLMNGEIAIVKNPRWSLEHYVEYMRQRGCI